MADVCSCVRELEADVPKRCLCCEQSARLVILVRELDDEANRSVVVFFVDACNACC